MLEWSKITIRHSFLSPLGLLMGSVWIPIAVMAAFMVMCGGIAIRFFEWE
ncbi:hypothetical protein [Mediterraneibacter agrestimuris]|nr:hypothetical protein [Mediterraneibacter agrestimuris]